jgi:hypothetical protein
MLPFTPWILVALIGVVAIAFGLAWSPKVSQLRPSLPPATISPVPAPPAKIPETLPQRTTNRQEFQVDSPAELILLASTQLSMAGHDELAIKATALSHEVRKAKAAKPEDSP